MVQFPVSQVDNSARELTKMDVVRHHDESDAVLLVELNEHFHDGLSIFRVQVASGLVEEKDVWEVDEGSCDGYALLLAA